MFVLWYATLAGILAQLVIYVVHTGAVGLHVAVVVFCISIDTFRQLRTLSLSTAVLGIDANACSRLNSLFLLSVRLSF